MTRATLYYTVYVRSYPWKAVEAMHVYTTTISSSRTLQQLLLRMSAISWSTILRQFTKNYDLFQSTTPKCRHYVSIAGKPIMLAYLMQAYLEH